MQTGKGLPRPQAKQPSDSMDLLICEFLESVTAVHKGHLSITGEGSYAAHIAMGSFYESIGDLVDGIAESYQGATGRLLSLSSVCEVPKIKTSADCINYLNTLYYKVHEVQKICELSEINNELDNVKSLINSTKYKLLFLK